MEEFIVTVRDKNTRKEKSMSFPVEKSEFDSAMKADNFSENLEFILHKCNAIPELNGAAFAEYADFAELNFLAQRIAEISKDTTQMCAYRALISEPPDNICEAINRTYGLETVPVYPCENVEEYGEIVLDNDFLEELEEIPYELYDLLDKEKVGLRMQKKEGGMFIDGYYVIPSEYEPVLAYDGIVLPNINEENTEEMEIEML
ncbi:MAG: antirestriction protein ArdA [Eubacterium sp.]|nr:antirestriction protein ArdA [Eubacterium sp.]